MIGSRLVPLLLAIREQLLYRGGAAMSHPLAK
jgi:hypothetical protein